MSCDFEWNPHKADRTVKHGLDLVTATEVFSDPHRLVRVDDRNCDEPRYQVIGVVAGVVLFVACTMRGEAYRIISARKARRDERKAYFISGLTRPPSHQAGRIGRSWSR